MCQWDLQIAGVPGECHTCTQGIQYFDEAKQESQSIIYNIAFVILRYRYITVAHYLPMSGCGVCGVLWCVRDCIWGVECDGQHDHSGPLVL